MKMRLVLLAMFSLQGTPLQQAGTGTMMGHVISRDSRANSTAAGIVVRARSLDRATFVSFAQTDEAGGYRLNGIPPGRYYIEAGLLDLPTYYPGAAELIDAKPVNVVA